MLATGHLHEKIYLCKKTRVKEGGGCLLKGGIFSRTYGTILQSPFSLILHWYHPLCLKPLCLQIVIVELVIKEQKCEHLCIVFTHECSGRFLTLHVYMLGHNLHTALVGFIIIHHTYVTQISIPHCTNSTSLFSWQYCLG